MDIRGEKVVLKKSVRTRYRYLLVKSDLEEKQLSAVMRKIAREYLGKLYIPKIKILGRTEDHYIVRVSREQFNKFRVALVLWEENTIRIVKSSGTIRALTSAFNEKRNN